jgi:hypothetical protein
VALPLLYQGVGRGERRRWAMQALDRMSLPEPSTAETGSRSWPCFTSCTGRATPC